MLINRFSTIAFVIVNGKVFNRSNGLIIQYLSMFHELKEVKYLTGITDFKNLMM